MGIATFLGLGHYGELGNQMFQIAAVEGYANRHSKTALFPEWICKISGRDYRKVFRSPVAQSSSVLQTLQQEGAQQVQYMDLKYVELPSLEGNVNFTGYFQSEKYFSNVEDLVRTFFQPSEDIEKYIFEKYRDLLSYENKVSLHIRTAKRSANDSDVHASATFEFIEQAMKDFTDKDLFVVFADNMEIAKSILPPGKSYYFVEGEENYIDLFLMTNFDSYIVSPSTFGWWGAWLSKHAEPRVTVMKDWFAKDKAKAYLNDNDIIPARWKAI
jgi:hypothetical protein